jgi:nucleotide sugar dehydrogenase
MKVGVSFPDRDVCIIGMGYVGLTLAVVMAEAGFKVWGVEINPDILAALKQGRAHFMEAGLDPRLATQMEEGNLQVSSEWPAPGAANVYIVTVGTPLAAGDKITNLNSIRAVTGKLSENLLGGELVLLRSTVRVGVSRDIVKPILDQAGVPYGLAFCPERTLEGRAMQELRTLPQIIGGLDQASAMRTSQLFNFLTPTTIRVDNLETAEMIKLINNTQRDLMFAFANEVAEMCDAIGVSALEVIQAGNMGYPRGSMPIPGPVGGPCLEKDPYILAEGLGIRGTQIRMPLLGRDVNEALPQRAAMRIATELAPRMGGKPIRKGVVMGLAFKGRPETSDLRGTLAIPLIAELRKAFPNTILMGYDPVVPAEDIEGLGLQVCSTPEEAFEGANFVVYQNNNAKFEKLDLGRLSTLMDRGALIYDLWSQYDPETIKLRDDISYFGWGTKVWGRAFDPARVTEVA